MRRLNSTGTPVILPRTDLLSPAELARPGAFSVLRAEARIWFRSNADHWQCAHDWATAQQALLARHGVQSVASVAESLEPYTPLLETELGYVVPVRSPLSTPQADRPWTLPGGEGELALLSSSGSRPLRPRPGESLLGRLRETAARHRPVTPAMLGWNIIPASPEVLIFSLKLTLPSGKKGTLHCGARRVPGPFEEVVFSSDALGSENQNPCTVDADLSYLMIAERPAREHSYRKEQLDHALINMSRSSNAARFTL